MQIFIKMQYKFGPQYSETARKAAETKRRKKENMN